MSQFGGEDVDRLRIALARIARLMDRQVSGDGMTRTQLSVLGTIARLGPLGISEVADIEGLNPTMLSRVLGKLEADGLVVRSAAVADRRAVRVQTTPAGRSLQQRMRRQRSQLLAERLTGLPRAQAGQLLAALPALETLAEQLNRPQPAKAPPAKAQPAKAPPAIPPLAKAQPGKAQPAKAQPGKAQPGKAQPGKAQPGKAQPGKAQPGKAQLRKPQPAQAVR